MPSRERRARRLGISVEDIPDGRGKHTSQPRGSNHYKWNSARLITKDGYKLIRVGKDHPLADPNGYAREHVVIMASLVGVEGVLNRTVHHKNGDRLDNRIENLELVTPGEHNKIHNVDRTRDPNTGRFVGRKRSGHMLDGREWRQTPGGEG